MVVLKLSKVGSKTVDEYELEGYIGRSADVCAEITALFESPEYGDHLKYDYPSGKQLILPVDVLRNCVIEVEEADDETPVLQDLP